MHAVSTVLSKTGTWYSTIRILPRHHIQTNTNKTVHPQSAPKVNITQIWLVGWSLTALLTRFRSYRAFKVRL